MGKGILEVHKKLMHVLGMTGLELSNIPHRRVVEVNQVLQPGKPGHTVYFGFNISNRKQLRSKYLLGQWTTWIGEVIAITITPVQCVLSLRFIVDVGDSRSGNAFVAHILIEFIKRITMSVIFFIGLHPMGSTKQEVEFTGAKVVPTEEAIAGGVRVGMSQTHMRGSHWLSLVADGVQAKGQSTPAKHTMDLVINVLGLTHLLHLNVPGILERVSSGDDQVRMEQCVILGTSCNARE